MDIRIPKLGEGAESGTVINIMVKEGDSIEKDQTLIELENEKAVAPIPSTGAGKVSKVHVSVGDTVSVGQVIVSLSGSDEAASEPAEKKAEETKEDPRPQPTVTSSHPKPEAPAPAEKAPVQAGVLEYQYVSVGGLNPPASPTIRKMARELGIDLGRVRGSESGGRITLSDIQAYIRALQAAVFNPRPGSGAQPPKVLPGPDFVDFSKWGPIERKKLSSLRKKIGDRMSASWTTIPHVTQNDEADITDLMAAAKKYARAYEKRGTRLTVTAALLKACVAALKKYPGFNSSLDENSGELVLKQYYHLGVAVDTEQGLIVPVLRDVDQKDLFQISVELAELAEKTRQRKVSLEDLTGGTFTISNLGGIGGGHFSPIINKPEVAILGVSRGVLRPVIRNKKIEQRVMMPFSLSYDHRVVDGADGARFVRELARALEDFPESEFKAGAGEKAAAGKKTGKAKAKKAKKGK